MPDSASHDWGYATSVLAIEVTRFTDEYELAAPLYDMPPADLRDRDEGRGRAVPRWLAVDDGVAIGAVTAWSRPDDRTFLKFVGRNRTVYPLLIDAVAESLGRRLHAHVDTSDEEALEALRASGFAVELVEEGFRIRFDTVLARLGRAWIPSGFSIVSAADVDKDRLFILDNTIRQDTPGTDGWRGDRRWFQDEFAEAPPFDASAYLVAIDDNNGEYVGLVRVWRNPNGPRLGLVGVVRQYRSTPIAAALLKQALTAASTWGHDTFVAETSPVNAVIYPRMNRLDAESLGQFLQMVRR